MKARFLRHLQRHPLTVLAFFRRSLVMTYALPKGILRPLLPPGLILDSLGGYGFVALALVQTEALRPAFLPRSLGQNFFLCGYRIFVRFRTRDGRQLRGLRILRSQTDRRLMVTFGNLLTHYHYHYAHIRLSETESRLEIEMRSRDATADLHVIAQRKDSCTALPASSPFADWHQARLFAGPLPFTFDYEPETRSIVLIEGVRQNWKPIPTEVAVLRNTFFEHPLFREAHPRLASAFRVENIAYKWKRGVVEPLHATHEN